MGLFDLFKKNQDSARNDTSTGCRVYDTKTLFLDVMENVDRFRRIYLGKTNEYMVIQIFTNSDREYYSSDFFYDYGYIEVRILAMTWWDGILGRDNHDIEDYMKSIFEYNDDWFVYKIRAGEQKQSTFLSNKYLVPQIHSYLQEFEATHPWFKFEHDHLGASWKSE